MVLARCSINPHLAAFSPRWQFSEQFIYIIRFKVLDGNHSVEVAKGIFGSDKRINCRVYYYELPAQESKSIADGEREARGRVRSCMIEGVSAMYTGTYKARVRIVGLQSGLPCIHYCLFMFLVRRSDRSAITSCHLFNGPIVPPC